MLTLVEGPAGSGKSQLVREMLASGEADIQADATALWVALTGAERGPDGKYPIRRADDRAIALALYLRRTAVRQALRTGRRVVVTSGTPNMAPEYAEIAQEAQTAFQVRTVDPGREAVESRLSDADGVLAPECDAAIGRWYG